MSDTMYDKTFHHYTLRRSLASAQPIVGILKGLFPITSVLDVGCSRGVWLRAWRDSGVSDYVGIDGDFLDRDTLLIDRKHFLALDLAQPFQLERRFDLVQCLEVAEHLPEERAAGLVADLTSHGSCVLFSAAPPGQGGENHINEKPYAYWRDLFDARGFRLIDGLRPLLRRLPGIAPWYRYNMFLFLRRDTQAPVPVALQQAEIPKNAPIPDVSPWPYRLRKALIRRLSAFLKRKV